MSRPEGASEEVTALYGRIDLLERRCGALQRKLGRAVRGPPLASGGSAADQGRPVWEPWVASVAGQRVAGVAVLLYVLLHDALRSFTHRLLKRDMWLWVFYAHLIALYAVAASCYAQVEVGSASSGSPVEIDVINTRLSQAAVDAATKGEAAG